MERMVVPPGSFAPQRNAQNSTSRASRLPYNIAPRLVKGGNLSYVRVSSQQLHHLLIPRASEMELPRKAAASVPDQAASPGRRGGAAEDREATRRR
eukprot:433467-Pleurochrysis_carterae.AAC.1